MFFSNLLSTREIKWQLCNKDWLFDDFAKLLKNQSICATDGDISINYQVFKCLEKYRLNIIIINDNGAKRVKVVDSNNQRSVTIVHQLMNKYEIERKNISHDERRIFVYSHGINGYIYDILNYFTEKKFVDSLNDKNICFFTNVCSCMPFDIMTKQKYQKNLKLQSSLISAIINDTVLKDGNVRLIFSGFSKGCCVNTDILSHLEKYLLNQVNRITIIAEAIPVMSILIANICKRYKKFISMLNNKSISQKTSLILIPVDPYNKFLSKHHPIEATNYIVTQLNKDVGIRHELNRCLCVLSCINRVITQKLSTKSCFVEHIFKNIADVVDMEYCPQQTKIW